TGNQALGNLGDGIDVSNSHHITIGGTDPGAGNVVSGNGSEHNGKSGINFYDNTHTTTNIVIQGNFIGTNAAGTAAIGNLGDGIGMWDAANTLIGGTTASARNIIAANGSLNSWTFGISAGGSNASGL